MVIKVTKNMTDSERIAVENSNNQYLRMLTYAPVGMIVPFGGDTVPGAFLVCDGSALDTTEYADLFNAIGYTYGGYDDSFYIPDLSGATVNGVNVKYIIKTTNGITEEERLKILASVDQTYNAESENAQSGKAVAEAIANTAVLKTQLAFTAQARKIPQYNDGRRIQTDTPVNSQDCVNKQYIDNNYYTKNEVDNLEAVKSISFKEYDRTDYTVIKDPYGPVVLALSYDESVVDVKDNYISNVRYPFESTDAATKGYVDDAVPNYELIEEITVTEDVEQILKKTSPDGTPYNFKAVTIEFSSEGVTGYSGKQLIEFNDGRVFKGNAEFLSDNRIAIIRGIYCGGLTFYDATWNAQSANSTTLNQNGYAIVPKIAQENVTKIHIRSAVKAGTVIKIYGIKV